MQIEYEKKQNSLNAFQKPGSLQQCKFCLVAALAMIAVIGCMLQALEYAERKYFADKGISVILVNFYGESMMLSTARSFAQETCSAVEDADLFIVVGYQLSNASVQSIRGLCSNYKVTVLMVDSSLSEKSPGVPSQSVQPSSKSSSLAYFQQIFTLIESRITTPYFLMLSDEWAFQDTNRSFWLYDGKNVIKEGIRTLNNPEQKCGKIIIAEGRQGESRDKSTALIQKAGKKAFVHPSIFTTEDIKGLNQDLIRLYEKDKEVWIIQRDQGEYGEVIEEIFQLLERKTDNACQHFSGSLKRQATDVFLVSPVSVVSAPFPNEFTSKFTSKSHNLKYFSNLLSYLHHNGAVNILHINCDQKCVQKERLPYGELRKTWGDHSMDIRYVQMQEVGSKLNKSKVFDWCICHNITRCAKQFASKPEFVKAIKYDVSFVDDDLTLNDTQMYTKLDNLFLEQGFYYDEIKSLNLMYNEKNVIRLYIRGRRKPIIPPYRSYEKPKRNFLAIQVVFRMIQNIPYMREWLGYHVAVGVDKFFLYDNSKTETTEWKDEDKLVTNRTTKIGLDMSCYNMTQEQAVQKWMKIWEQYYDHIVWVIWEPKDQTGRIMYGQVDSQKNYLQLYRNLVTFTSFVDIDEFMFAGEDSTLVEYLQACGRNQTYLIKIQPQHAPHRVCYPNKRITEVTDFMITSKKRLWSPKFIAKTSDFMPNISMHDSYLRQNSSGKYILAEANDVKLKHYHISKFQIKIREFFHKLNNCQQIYISLCFFNQW